MATFAQVGTFHPRRINQYCPAMQYTSEINGGPLPINLGAPEAFDSDGIDTDIDADAVAGTQTAQTATTDATYGQTVVFQPNGDPGATGTLDVYGRDYLGQPMVERFATASGSTAIQYGLKAFKWIDYTQIVVAAANATTYDLGWGYRSGLPFKSQSVLWVRENGVLVPNWGNHVITLSTTLSDAEAASGGSVFLRTPVPGYVSTLRGWHHTAGSTNDPVITVELGGVAITGLTVTLDVSGTVGTVQSDTPTTAGYNANNRLSAGDMVEVIGAAAASANSYTMEVDVIPTSFTVPDTTDAATVSTGDPRGTFEPITPFDGTIEYVVCLVPDADLNASGNGGLHGIQHYYP